jgi:hypothetical protein
MQLGRKEHKKSKGKIIIAKGRNSQMDSKKDNRVYRATLVLIKNSFVFFLVSFIGQSCYNVITPGTTAASHPASSGSTAKQPSWWRRQDAAVASVTVCTLCMCIYIDPQRLRLLIKTPRVNQSCRIHVTQKLKRNLFYFLKTTYKLWPSMYTQKKKSLDFDMDTNINLISQVFSHSSTRKESL